MTTKAPPRDKKDRARPFSKKHRKYWLPVTGGMILIGALNVGIGMCSYDAPSDRHEKIELVMPKSPMWNTGEPIDAGVDAGADAAGSGSSGSSIPTPPR